MAYVLTVGSILMEGGSWQPNPEKGALHRSSGGSGNWSKLQVSKSFSCEGHKERSKLAKETNDFNIVNFTQKYVRNISQELLNIRPSACSAREGYLTAHVKYSAYSTRYFAELINTWGDKICKSGNWTTDCPIVSSPGKCKCGHFSIDIVDCQLFNIDCPLFLGELISRSYSSLLLVSKFIMKNIISGILTWNSKQFVVFNACGVLRTATQTGHDR